MFNSTKIGDSPRLHKTNLHATMNETANGLSRHFLHPKITSTPLHSPISQRRETVYATPPKPSIMGPKRYSLSEMATPPRHTGHRRELNRSNHIQNASGPLLASTRYNVNVSTYMDSMSPGLAGRIVQYNEERERSMPTHQPKYGSPGLLPIVHLFKKQLPTLNQTPKRVTVRIASPEQSRHNSQEYNRMLMEGIVRSNSTKSGLTSPQSESSTRSVLDALKEISRKRIHASEEYELNEESGKRVRTEEYTDSNKRYRDDSPLLENSSPSKPVPKRICVYDEYAASRSSTDFSFVKEKLSDKNSEYRTKRKSISTITEIQNPKETKQVKLINAETQTQHTDPTPSENASLTSLNSTSSTNTIPSKESVEDDSKIDNTEEEKPPERNIMTVFSNEPLERIRKNRLAALIGTLAGKETYFTPKPELSLTLESNPETDKTLVTSTDAEKTADKPLISILSTPKKTSPKSDKHVTFCLPGGTSNAFGINSATSSSSNTSLPISVSITQTSGSVVTPIVSTNISEPSVTTLTANKSKDLTAPTPPTSPVMFDKDKIKEADLSKTPSIPSFSQNSLFGSTFSLPKQTTSANESLPNDKPNFMFTNAKTPPSLGILSPVASSTQVSSASATSISSSTTFNLSATSTPNFSFGAPKTEPSTTSSPPKQGGFKFDLNKPLGTPPVASSISGPSTNGTPTFSFGQNSDTNVTKPATFGGTTSNTSINTTVPSFAGNATGGFSFSTKSTTSTSIPESGISNVSNTFKGGFGTSSAMPTSVTTTVSNASTGGIGSTFKFGGEPKPQMFKTSNSSPTPNFGNSSVNTGFGNKLGSNLGTNLAVTSAPSFATNIATSTKPSFGSNISSPPAFGSNSTSKPMFGGSTATTAPAFGGTVTATTISFGSNVSSGPPAFGGNTSSTPPPYGANTTTTAAPSFGGNIATSTPAFGTSTGFGGNNKSSLFAFGATATTSATASTTPTFGSTTTTASSVFGVGSKPAFGVATTSASPFSAPTGSFVSQNTPQSGFGSVQAAVTTTASFGTSNTAPFGASGATSSIFGTNGGTAAPAFGAAATNMFGAPNNQTQAFGNATASSKPMFGRDATANTTTPFGAAIAATTTSSFVGGTPAFGSAFGAKTTASNMFGTASTPAFGTTTTASSTFGSNTTPAFGGAATNTFGSATSGFGATTGFGATNNTPAFGSPAAVTTNSSSFGANSTPAFGAANSSFGSASGSAFANTSTPAFGSGTAPAFGGSASTQNAFGSSSSNSFSTGFGSNNNTSAFAKPQPTQNSFGSPTNNAFGNNASASFGVASQNSGAFAPPTTQSGGVFTFGGGSSAAKPAAFSFSGSTETPKPSFNFTGGNASHSSTFSFGSNAPPAFGATPAVPAFGGTEFNASVPPAAGGFSIGTGSTPNRQRTQLKAKRRT